MFPIANGCLFWFIVVLVLEVSGYTYLSVDIPPLKICTVVLYGTNCFFTFLNILEVHNAKSQTIMDL